VTLLMTESITRIASADDVKHGGDWPRITLVTAVLNSARFIEQTMRSVLSQSYPNLEYFIVDGGSTDGTVDIIRRYERDLVWWVSEPDQGHFDALNKGFARSSGSIMGWINGSDQLHVGSLFVVGSVFRTFPSVEWITGIPTTLNQDGMVVNVARLPRWSRIRFLAGANRYIQQESTFWRRSIWDRAGGYMDASRRIANDFELWVRFFRHARLCSVNALIGGYRCHGDSVTSRRLTECHRIHDEIIEAELDGISWGKAVRAFRQANRIVQRIPKVRSLWNRCVIQGLYTFPGPDWPPVIEYAHGQTWRVRQ